MLSTWATLRFKWPELKGLARVLFEWACLSMPVHFGVLSVHPTQSRIPVFRILSPRASYRSCRKCQSLHATIVSWPRFYVPTTNRQGPDWRGTEIPEKLVVGASRRKIELKLQLSNCRPAWTGILLLMLPMLPFSYPQSHCQSCWPG